MTGAIFIIEDVTKLRYNDEMKRGVISTVSHQLKTPLTSIRMAIHLLLDEKIGPLTPKQEELIIAAREDSDRLNNIIEDLLNVGRIQSGRVQMEFTAVSPRDVVMESAEEFRTAAVDSGVLVQTELPEDLPDAFADLPQIRHVLNNLLSNALKFTPAGGTVTISARSDESFVYITVSDTGTGITPESLVHVFDQFFTASGGKEKTKGAGLGLYIAKEIVEAHGGTIEAKSRPGRGSAFTFSLRRADSKKGDSRRMIDIIYICLILLFFSFCVLFIRMFERL